MAAAEHQNQLLETVQVYGAVFEKTAEMMQKQSAMDQKVAALIPKAVEALLANERIEPHQKDAAAAILRDPDKALEILIKTAYHRNGNERSHLGQPVDQKTKKAAIQSTKSAYVGARAPSRKESDLAFAARLGVELPPE